MTFDFLKIAMKEQYINFHCSLKNLQQRSKIYTVLLTVIRTNRVPPYLGWFTLIITNRVPPYFGWFTVIITNRVPQHLGWW